MQQQQQKKVHVHNVKMYEQKLNIFYVSKNIFKHEVLHHGLPQYDQHHLEYLQFFCLGLLVRGLFHLWESFEIKQNWSSKNLTDVTLAGSGAIFFIRLRPPL